MTTWIKKAADFAINLWPSSRPFTSLLPHDRLERCASLDSNGELRPLTKEDVEEMLAPLLRRSSELRTRAKKLHDMAHRYQAIGKIDQNALNSMATIDLRAADALEVATRLYGRLSFEDPPIKTRWQRVIADLAQTQATIDRALASINETREIIVEGKFLR